MVLNLGYTLDSLGIYLKIMDADIIMAYTLGFLKASPGLLIPSSENLVEMQNFRP